jgi:hypothetical protein
MPTPTIDRSEIKLPAGYRSPSVASFIAQLDDQLTRLRRATRGLNPADLQWQPARGMNTIGMLLAHIAIVEVYWTMIALAHEKKPEVRDVLGIGEDDDGLPIPENAEPIALLNGKDLAFYDDLLDRARAYFKRMAKDALDDDLDREIPRTRPDGSVRVFNVRWYFYHLLEHFSGHFGQILLLKHMRGAVQGS